MKEILRGEETGGKPGSNLGSRNLDEGNKLWVVTCRDLRKVKLGLQLSFKYCSCNLNLEP
jgi:hypothetical protein